MIGLLLDLVNQVRGVLPARFGGTGNDHGWGNDAVIAPYPNGTGSTITRGTLVQLALVETIGHEISSDTRIKPTTTAKQMDVLGVVVGRVRATDSQYEDEDPATGEIAAVCLFGRCVVQVEGTVTVGQFAYSAATDGKAAGDDLVLVGAMGQFESSGTGQAWVRLRGGAQTPGVAGSILFVFGDNTYPLQAGSLVDVPAPPFGIRFTHWTLVSTLTGTVQLDIYKDTYANFPPTPADSITGTEPPYITGGVKNDADVPYGHDSFGTPTGWGDERDIDNGDVLRCIVESADGGVKQVSLLLDYIRR